MKLIGSTKNAVDIDKNKNKKWLQARIINS